MIRTSSGWNSFLDLFDRHIGLHNVLLLHLNDSKAPFDSGKDKHEELCRTYIQ